MNITTIVQTLTPLADAFEFYGIPYHLTGSLATSVYVKTQVVQGMEVVADIKFSQVQALVVQLEKTYDVKEIAMRAAIEHRGSFRLVNHDTLQKIDVALPAYRAYSQVRQEKAQSRLPAAVGNLTGCSSLPRAGAGFSRSFQCVAGSPHTFDMLSTCYPQVSTHNVNDHITQPGNVANCFSSLF